jgi:HK97 family phage portal protein
MRSAYGWLVGREPAHFGRRDPYDALSLDDGYFGGGWGVRSATGIQITQQTAMACDAVMACVSLLAEDVAKLKPRLVQRFEDGRRKPAVNQPFHQLTRRPNDWQTWQEFATMMMVGLLLRGNGYAVIVRDGRGRPIYLVPINPDKVGLWESPSGDLFYMVNRTGLHEMAKLATVPFLVPAADMFHLKGLSANGLLGLSKISLNRESIGLALAQEQQAARWLGNGARPSGILTTDAKLTPEVAQRCKDNWQSAQGGIANSGKTAVLEMGLKWQPLSMTSQDIEFIASRTFQLHEVARLWRVPPHMIGELTKATNNSLTQLSQEYVNYTLSTYTEMWSQRAAVTFDFPDGVELIFDMSILLRGDVATRYQNYRLGQQGWLTCNEIRDAEGLDPVADGDKIFRPVNMAPIDSDVFQGVVDDPSPGAGVGSDAGGDNPGAGQPGASGNPEQDASAAG